MSYLTQDEINAALNDHYGLGSADRQKTLTDAYHSASNDLKHGQVTPDSYRRSGEYTAKGMSDEQSATYNDMVDQIKANMSQEGMDAPDPDNNTSDRVDAAKNSLEASMSALNGAQQQVDDELRTVNDQMQRGDMSPNTVARKEALEEEKRNLQDARTLTNYDYEMLEDAAMSPESLEDNSTPEAKLANDIYDKGAADAVVKPFMDKRDGDDEHMSPHEGESETGENSGESNPDDPNSSESGDVGNIPVEEVAEDEFPQDIETLPAASGTTNPPEAEKKEEKGTLTEADKGRMIDLARRSSGFGSYFGQIQTFMSEMNMFESQAIPGNLLLPGPTFITRPRLNLQGPNIVGNALLAPLATMNELSLAFGIRAWLDTNLWHVEEPLKGDPKRDWLSEHKERMKKKVMNCPFVTDNNPFFAPLCNALMSINGFPNPSIQTESSEGGYFGEAQTWASGGSLLAEGNYNLSLEFMDVQGSPILSIFKYWMEFMRCLRTGEVVAYGDDIDANRLCYTVSIYQFIMEPGYKYIAHYCKCTGCFPTGDLPMGTLFSKSKDKHSIQEAMQFSIPFTCNVVEYDKPHILTDFNHLVTRYNPTIAQYESGEKPSMAKMIVLETEGGEEIVREKADIAAKQKEVSNTIADRNRRKHMRLPYDGFASGIAIPFITSDRFGYKLEYRFMGEQADRRPTYGIGAMTTDELKAIEENMMIDMSLKRDSYPVGFGPGFGLQYPEFYKKLENEKRGADEQFREFIKSLKNATGVK